MSSRPSDKKFINWAKDDQNKSKMQKALRAHPDLANVKDWVSCNQICFKIL